MFGFHSFSENPYSALSGGEIRFLAAVFSATASMSQNATLAVGVDSTLNGTVVLGSTPYLIRNINSNLTGDLTVNTVGSLVVSGLSGLNATVNLDSSSTRTIAAVAGINPAVTLDPVIKRLTAVEMNMTDVVTVDGVATRISKIAAGLGLTVDVGAGLTAAKGMNSSLTGQINLASDVKVIRSLAVAFNVDVTINAAGQRVVGVGSGLTNTITTNSVVTAFVAGKSNSDIIIVVNADAITKEYKDIIASLGLSLVVSPRLSAILGIGGPISVSTTMGAVGNLYVSGSTAMNAAVNVSGDMYKIQLLAADLNNQVVMTPTAGLILSGASEINGVVTISPKASMLKLVASDLTAQVNLEALLTELVIVGEYNPVAEFTLYIDRQTNKVLSIERNYIVDFQIDRTRSDNLNLR